MFRKNLRKTHKPFKNIGFLYFWTNSKYWTTNTPSLTNHRDNSCTT
ncbi:hypothetical protein [Rubritalea tangerina]